MITLVAAAAFGAVVGAFLVWLHWRLMHAYKREVEHSAEIGVKAQSLTYDIATYEEYLRAAVERHRAEHRRCVYLSEALAKLRSMSAAVGNLAVLVDDMLRAAPPGAVPPRQPQTEPTTLEEEDHG